MRVLIVGGTSTLGVAAKAALSPHCEVVTAGRHGCDIEVDLAWPLERLRLPADVDTIVNTAAHFPGATPEDALAAEEVNALGAQKLCIAASRAGVKHFVLVSTMFALAGPGSRAFNAYSVSKRHGEELARLACAATGLALAILRPSQIYGPGRRVRDHQPFLFFMLERARDGLDIELYGTRDPRRNYIHVKDLAQILARVVKQGVCGTFACQHPADVTYSQVAAAAYRAFGTSGTVRHRAEMPDIPDNVFALEREIYARVGFEPATTLDAGILSMARSL